MAEWLGKGLQNLVQRFDSASDLKKNRVVDIYNAVPVLLYIYHTYILYSYLLNLVNRLRHSSNYSMAIEKLLRPILPKRILYGVGMPYTERNLQKSLLQKDKVDFIIFSGNSEKTEVIYDNEEVFK